MTTAARRDRLQVVIAVVLIAVLVLSPIGIALILGSDVLQALPWTLIIAVFGAVLIIWLVRRGRNST
jgi:hypothetical protein